VPASSMCLLNHCVNLAFFNLLQTELANSFILHSCYDLLEVTTSSMCVLSCCVNILS
jgi:hypothetical protein